MYDPERYENNKAAAGNDAAEFVPRLIKQMFWKREEKILDYGCGAGSVCTEYLVPMAERYKSTIDAVDTSDDMLEFAKANNSHALVQFMKDDIMKEDFIKGRTEAYDRIFSIYVLHFMRDYKLALERFFEILKPGGELGFTVIGKACMFEILELLGKNSKWSSYMKGYERFLPLWYVNGEDPGDSFNKTLLDIGFAISEITTEERSHAFEFEVWIQMFMSLNPFLKKIPSELYAELTEEYRTICKGFLDNCEATGAGTHYKYYMVLGLATKPMQPSTDTASI